MDEGLDQIFCDKDMNGGILRRLSWKTKKNTYVVPRDWMCKAEDITLHNSATSAISIH